MARMSNAYTPLAIGVIGMLSMSLYMALSALFR